MPSKQQSTGLPSWIKTLVLIAFAAVVTGACKESSTSTGGVSVPVPMPGSGMPSPPSGSPPSPPGGSSGGSPPPPGGSSGSSGGSSGSSGGSDGGGMPGGEMPGGGMPGGSSGPTGSSGQSGNPGGDVGSFPGGGDETAGVPPPPSSSGGGGDAEGESTEAGGAEGAGDSEQSAEWEDDVVAEDSECGATGGLPGGVGGMGQDGECIGGGGASSSDDAEAASEGAAGGGGAPAGGVQGTGGAGGVAEFPGESDEERAARLGRELEESVGGFDEVLQEEQEEIAAVGRNTEGFGEGTTGASGGGISLGQQAGGGGGGGGGSGGSGPVSVANSGIARESATAGMSMDDIRERTPDDIPLMVDDDIIARQLREAALTEDDPALRERLWEEYRKYSGL